MLEEAINALVDIGRKEFQEPFTVGEGGIPVMIVPVGNKEVNAEHLLANPVRPRANIECADVKGFVAYHEKHADAQTLVTASTGGKKITAIFDHHSQEKAGWQEHQATLALKPSPEWSAWVSNANKLMTQTAFAEFIEDWAHTVVEPDSAKLIDVALNLQATSEMKFDSRVNRFTGGTALTYVEDVSLGSKGSIKVPETMVICAAPFLFGKPVDMLVRLRVRIKDGKAMFQYVLDRPYKAEQEAFDVICAEVGESIPAVTRTH